LASALQLRGFPSFLAQLCRFSAAERRPGGDIVKKITLDIFENRIILNYKPYEILKGNAIKWFPGCGFWKIREPNERNPLKIKFIIEKTDFEEEDRKILEGLREKYAKGK
jgi:hypothetical protein